MAVVWVGARTDARQIQRPEFSGAAAASVRGRCCRALEDYTIALAGSAVEKSFGGRILGTSFGNLNLGPAKEEVVEEYQLCAMKRVAIASRHHMRVRDAGVLELQRVLLPFNSPMTGAVAHVIGWFRLSPMPPLGLKGAVTRWTTDERLFVSAAI